MRKGGYTILDFSNIPLTASEGNYIGTVPRKTYEAIRNSGKPVYVAGMKLGSTLYDDSLATFTSRANANQVTVNYLMTTGYFIGIVITNAGAVTITIND